jgi:hypothetical protein
MKRHFSLVAASFLLAAALVGAEPSKPQNPSPAAGATPDANSKAALETRNHVKELIKLINLEPNLITVNPKAEVVKDPNWRPIGPDGKRNQDFRVAPDDTAPEISQAVMAEWNRERWTKELIKTGSPAVPELMAGALDTGNKYRYYLIYALGQIKDLHGAPAVLKYYSDAVDMDKLANSIERMGDKEEAERVRRQVAFEKSTALYALKSMSGQDFGDDYGKWDNWWKETEKKIGKVDLPVLYEIQGKKSQKTNTVP